MNISLKKTFVLAISIPLLFSSCVSSKKYKESQESLDRLRKNHRELREDFEAANNRISLMESANQAALEELSEKNRLLSEKDLLINEKDQLLSSHSSTLEDQNAKLQQLQILIDQQKAQTEKLRSKMADALGSFSSEELSVFTKDGKVYVSLSEQLLFPSGSADVNNEGRGALEKLAQALQEHADIQLNIEGHTDTVPIRFKFQDNWALSVARSTAIVRILTEQFGIDPKRVVASGKSQYEPVADNTTSEGRAKNRRTEIILAPKLDQLMELLEYTED